MSSFPEPGEVEKLVLAVARKTSHDPAFLEKQWYILQGIGWMASFGGEHGVELVLRGGTAMVNAHGEGNRFSEDIDYLGLSTDPGTPIGGNKCKRLHGAICDHFAGHPYFELREGPSSHARNRLMMARFSYPNRFEHRSVSPDVKLDVRFQDCKLEPCIRPVRSIVSDVLGHEPEAAALKCVSLVETAADKFGALALMVFGTDPGDDRYKPENMRHLHDIAVLKRYALEDFDGYIASLRIKLQDDMGNRSKKAEPIGSYIELFDTMVRKLEDQKGRRSADYQRYVDEMSYLPADERIGYDRAVADIKELSARVKPEIRDLPMPSKGVDPADGQQPS